MKVCGSRLTCNEYALAFGICDFPKPHKESVSGIDASNEDTSTAEPTWLALASCKTLASRRAPDFAAARGALLDTELEGSVLDLWQQYLATARSISSQQYAAEQFQ